MRKVGYQPSNDNGGSTKPSKEYPPGMVIVSVDLVSISSYIIYIEDSLTDETFPLIIEPKSDGSDDQQSAFWMIYNKTGLQYSSETQPVDILVENEFQITFPPDPPYLGSRIK